jgi:thiamine biosynthesis lipoprotein
MKKTLFRLSIPVLAGLLLNTGFVSCSGGDKSPEGDRAVVFRTGTMGTWASLTLVTADSAATADLAYESLGVLHFVDSLMSNWTNSSEVARINRDASSRTLKIHPDVADVIAVAQDVASASEGAFDITVEPLARLWGFLGGRPRVPRQDEITRLLMSVGYHRLDFDRDNQTLRFEGRNVGIDLGGIAKGYGVDRVAAALRAAGVTNALVDLSGNMVAIGNAADHPGWAVGIRDPAGKVPWLARLVLYDEAVATSGDYEQFVDADGRRYGHILDPRTGWSAGGLSSVTVVCNRAVVADAWATALFVLGPEEARRIAADRDDLSVVLIEPGANGTAIVWVEEHLRRRFDLVTEMKSTHTVRYF